MSKFSSKYVAMTIQSVVVRAIFDFYPPKTALTPKCRPNNVFPDDNSSIPCDRVDRVSVAERFPGRAVSTAICDAPGCAIFIYLKRFNTNRNGNYAARFEAQR